MADVVWKLSVGGSKGMAGPLSELLKRAEG